MTEKPPDLSPLDLPEAGDVRSAAARIAGVVHRTPIISNTAIDDVVGASVFMKAEHLQKVGAFKARGAANAVLLLPVAEAGAGVCCHSSGNHGQALAWAARTQGIDATVVMPRNAPRVKADAIEGYGAEIVWCEPNSASRESTVEEVRSRTGAAEIHPFDNPHVMAGAGTAALELHEQVPGLDVLIVPLGGGGLLSGSCIATAATSPSTALWGAEPSGADDAARSVAAGRVIEQTDPDTICDGLLTSLSERTFAVIAAGVERIALVDDAAVVAAMRLLWERAKQVVEPSGAIGLAVAIAHRDELAGKRVGVMLTGGNVDLTALPF